MSRTDIAGQPISEVDELRAELARVTAENGRLLEWQRLHDAAPEQAKGIVLDRLRESGALTPIVESWKAEVEKLTSQLKAAREALPACIERSLRTYTLQGQHDVDGGSVRLCDALTPIDSDGTIKAGNEELVHLIDAVAGDALDVLKEATP